VNVLEEFQQFKERHEQLVGAKHKAEGALQELRRRTQKEHGCKTLDQVNAMRKKKRAQLEKLEALVRKLMKEFNEKWPE